METRFLFLVNDVHTVQPSQTTAMLITAAAQHYPVWITQVDALSCRNDGTVWAYAKQVLAKSGETISTVIGATAQQPWQAIALKADTPHILFIRTNPARDLHNSEAHRTALSLTRLAEQQGITVINRPDGLTLAATKLYLLELPTFTRPPTLVSQRPDEAIDFIKHLSGPAILKPLQGTRGKDVFFIASAKDKNLNQIIDVIVRQGPLMAQGYIPGAEAGDTRVLVMNGKVLEMEEQPAAIQRVPNQGDFRSNIHVGAKAAYGTVTEQMRQVVAAIGPKLLNDGLYFVGLDFINAQLVELNVFSPGGLRDVERFTGAAFAERVIQEVISLI